MNGTQKIPNLASGGGNQHNSLALDDPRVTEALEEYLAEMEGGQGPGREEFLARHADIAPALRICLESIEALQLARHLSGSSSLEGNIKGGPLGDFRIVREIGRGGMGIVYEAEQISLGRRVALKVLPFAATHDARQIQRFKKEAHAAATLHHANIVPIYGVGCERGVHFYAMHYIEGQNLSTFIQHMRQRRKEEPSPAAPESTRDLANPSPESPLPRASSAPTKPTGLLSTQVASQEEYFQNISRIVLEVAEALEHAHQCGVVHRDIKPANLLLDETGKVWVTDFGLARIPSEGGLTVSGDLIGTLRYMSPEQALARRGVVDHRTDIYSLAATFYELATLEPVFPGQDREELLRQITLEEPVAPRRLDRAIPKDLETIVRKGMAKHPEERYGTAQEMADDLRRFLNDQPIWARPPSLMARGVKWTRRHRGLAASFVVFLLLAVVGLAVSNILIAGEQGKTQTAYNLLLAEQQKSEAAYRAETVEREKAQEHFRKAQHVLNFFTQVAEEDLADNPGFRPVRRKLLEAAFSYFQEFIDHAGDDPAVRDELSLSHIRVANILEEMGAQGEVLPALEKARDWHHKVGHGHSLPPWFAHNLFVLYQNIGIFQGQVFLPLLAQKSVQKELALTSGQIAKLQPLFKGQRALFEPGNFSKVDPDSIRKKSGEWRRNCLKQIEQILAPEQLKRLRQIALQQRGIEALEDPQVADALHLTGNQKAGVQTILKDYRKNFSPPKWGKGYSNQGTKSLGHIKNCRKQCQEKLFRLLSRDQKTAWEELIGIPFRGEIHFHNPYSLGSHRGRK